MMKQFNVLDRDLPLHQHYLLEASAGTGKTFSIQNIVVRLLIEPIPGATATLNLNQILVVTFTRAATRDLKQRIRLNIEQSLDYIDNWLRDANVHEGAPDYLVAHLERGEDHVREIKKKLQQALFTFDQAQIFTIHSFCSRMLRQHALESDVGLKNVGEEPLPQSEVMRIIRDFFRTGIRKELYSPGQLAIILKEDPEQKKLLRAMMSGYDVMDVPSFSDLYQQFQAVMKRLKQNFNLTADEMIADFEAQMGLYRNYKSGETKGETLAKVERFAKLFDKAEWTFPDFDLLIEEDLVWPQALDPSLLKLRATLPSQLRYPRLTSVLKDELEPIVYLAREFPFLLARLAKDCQQLLRRYQKEEEKLSPDDLLKKMDESLERPSFQSKIQSLYAAAIIDEFQDTDPIQWRIFQRLFLPEDGGWNGYLYLVGDPKQSIYSFRQADIYTYLSAAQLLGQHRCFSLDTNYRSQPTLVQALNVLFKADHLSDFIVLPKRGDQLLYQEVRASERVSSKAFQDDLGAAHFFIGDGSHLKKAKLADLENEAFFPFITREIQRLQEQENMHYSQFAVLVRDRHQALRLAEFFGKNQIPYVNQRGVSLADSVALSSLTFVLKAILHPRDFGSVKSALGTPLMGWTHDHLIGPYSLEKVLLGFYKLRKVLFEQGFAPFFESFLHSSWREGEISILENILGQEGGLELYHDLQQIADLIVDHHYKEWSGPEGLIPFLDRFKLWQENEDERVKRFQDPAKEGVKILTLHFSKGLEFDVVFALGLVSRTWVQEELIPIEIEGKVILSPSSEKKLQLDSYFEELDAEKMRQLYVAMTRAKYRLYIPVALHLASEQLSLGEASPMDLFLARLNQPKASLKEVYARIKSYNGHFLFAFLDEVGKQNHITYSICCLTGSQNGTGEELLEPLILHSPPPVQIPGSPIIMASFSSLARSLVPPQEDPSGDSHIPHDFKSPVKTVHTLPSNYETGLLLHRIFETLDFKKFQAIQEESQAVDLIASLIPKGPFAEWSSVLAQIAFHTLKTPLFEGQIFCLADIGASFYREMPFVFICDIPSEVEGIELSSGYVKGVIDLIFGHQGKYYIVDWKSNWLGPNVECYQEEYLLQAMQEHDYFLQASLYKEALMRYLELVDPRPFEECFGGIFYLFLRGMQKGQRTGIFYLDHKQ